MTVDLITRDEADHLARRVVATHRAGGNTRLDRALRRAERWRQRYADTLGELRQARELIEQQDATIERLADALAEHEGRGA